MNEHEPPDEARPFRDPRRRGARHWFIAAFIGVDLLGFGLSAFITARGDVPKQPVFLGFYTVTLAEVNNNGVVCLWICPEGHRCIGFGNCKASDVRNNFFNLNIHVNLSDRWQFVEED